VRRGSPEPRRGPWSGPCERSIPPRCRLTVRLGLGAPDSRPEIGRSSPGAPGRRPGAFERMAANRDMCPRGAPGRTRAGSGSGVAAHTHTARFQTSLQHRSCRRPGAETPNAGRWPGPCPRCRRTRRPAGRCGCRDQPEHDQRQDPFNRELYNKITQMSRGLNYSQSRLCRESQIGSPAPLRSTISR